MNWKLATLVALGGAVGSVARYSISGWATRGDFPAGTLLVNAAGCFLIGLVIFGGMAGGWLSPSLRVFLGIGLLGGFTTMSSFTYEGLALVEASEYARAAGYVGATLGSCFVGTLVGRALGLALWSGGT